MTASLLKLRFSNILDPVEDELDQHLFKGIDPRPAQTEFIQKHCVDELRKADVPDPETNVDLYLTGSITTFQYSDDSDIDISLFPHYDALVAAGFGTDPNDVRKQLIRIVIDRIDGVVVPGTVHPVQNFVVPPGIGPEDLYQAGLRSAWSFKSHTWIVPPEKQRSHDVQRELPLVYLRAKAIAEKMRVALDTDPAAAKRMFQRIHMKRSAEQQKGRGDFSEGNIVYKYLLHEGLFDRLRGLGVYIAGSPDAGFEDWTCPDCGASGRDNVYEDPEGGFECRNCGMAIISKIAAEDEMSIIYNFDNDRIILGSKDSAGLPLGVLIGKYSNGHVTMYEAAHQWMNTAYFKRLWAHSFPDKPLKSVNLHRTKGPERIAAGIYDQETDKEIDPFEHPEEPPREDENTNVFYIQAFIYFGKPINQLEGTDADTEHSDIIERTVEHFQEELLSRYEPQTAWDKAFDYVMKTPQIAGHVGETNSTGAFDTPYSERIRQKYVVFYSDALHGQLDPSLIASALAELRKIYPNIKIAPQWVVNQRWYQG